MAKVSGPERVENMVKVLRQWQSIERQAMHDTASIMEQTRNPLVRMIMAIIRHDSLMHHQVQQFLIDSVTEEAVAVSRDDLAEIWERIEEHDKMEKKTIALARQLMEEAWSPVQKQMLNYLLTDESKHDSLLMELEQVKQGMTQASGA